MIQTELRRLSCRGCGRTGFEAVPWASTDSGCTRDFEDLVAWLAQQMNTTRIAELMRIGWDSVGRIAERVVAEYLDGGRLDGLARLGVDEIHHAHGHQFLTCIADHDSGRVVWAQPGRCAASWQAFFEALSEQQRASIKVISMDMSAGYEKAVRDTFTDAENQPAVAFDPFHVIQLGGRAVDQVRRQLYNEHGRSSSEHGKWIKGARYSLLKRPENQTVRQLATLHEVQITNKPLYRAFLLLHELRGVYEVPAEQPADALDAWVAWASRSKLKPFVKLARTIRKHKSGILAAIELGISNGRLEGLNSKIRLLSHRAYGFHSTDALIAMIYLCCSNITISLSRT